MTHCSAGVCHSPRLIHAVVQLMQFIHICLVSHHVFEWLYIIDHAGSTCVTSLTWAYTFCICLSIAVALSNYNIISNRTIVIDRVHDCDMQEGPIYSHIGRSCHSHAYKSIAIDHNTPYIYIYIYSSQTVSCTLFLLPLHIYTFPLYLHVRLIQLHTTPWPPQVAMEDTTAPQ